MGWGRFFTVWDPNKGVVSDVDSLDRNYLRSVWHELHELCCVTRAQLHGSFIPPDGQKHWWSTPRLELYIGHIQFDANLYHV